MKELNLEEELDKLFPKGDKARGKALVLFAVAQIEIQRARKEILKEIKEFFELPNKNEFEFFEVSYESVNEFIKTLEKTEGKNE